MDKEIKPTNQEIGWLGLSQTIWLILDEALSLTYKLTPNACWLLKI